MPPAADEAEQLRRDLMQWSALCPDLQVPGKIDQLVAEFKARKDADGR